MWTADQPTFGVAKVASACASTLADQDLANRVEEAIPGMVENSGTYFDRGIADTLWSSTDSDFPLPTVTSVEMRSLYTNKLVAHGSARDFYDRLLAAAYLSRCPYCNHNRPRTLDHFLPKSEYPSLSIEPWNLVPACGDCNFYMRNFVPGRREESMFHPYFTFVADGWLAAETDVIGSAIAVRFYPARTPGMSDELLERVETAFCRLRLADMYAAAASGAIAELSQVVDKLFRAGGELAIRSHLRDIASSCSAVGPNQWRGVLYSVLAEDDWYCTGGFRSP